ncbi:hypothetical protein D9C01_12840, partial [Corynebacterium diphtheriae]
LRSTTQGRHAQEPLAGLPNISTFFVLVSQGLSQSDDDYRHSKWLSFMERRLLVAKELLSPENSVLIVTIDEKEYLRLGMLLEQTFPEAHMTMVTSSINNAGASRAGTFGRAAEYIYFLRFGESRAIP